MALINCQDVDIAYGAAPLLQRANMLVEKNERIGLLGRNGEGKSTLLKLLARDIQPDDGAIRYANGVVVARLSQEVPATLAGTVDTVIRDGTERRVDDHIVERLCTVFDLSPESPFASLSGGQKRKALLARALVREPDVLLLDEPTNHLDIETILELESFLERFTGSLVFVTHDRAFLQRLATRIVELDRGQLTSWDCDYPTFLRRKEAFLDAEEVRWAQFDKKLAKEEVWVRQGIKARRTRNEGRVRALKKLRAERAARRDRIGEVRMTIHAAEKSGYKVIKAEAVQFRYDDPSTESFSLQPLTAEIVRGDRIGIIGPNGCGKTTLLHLLLGKLEPQAGTVTHGTRLQVAYFDQHRAQLDVSRSVVDNISNGHDHVVINGVERHAIGYLGDFLFSPDRARQPVSLLSGGERNRLLLARLFAEPSNVLVLDEPTNDLDAETLELLETRLLDYAGTVLLVSHDRRFLDNIATSSLVFEAPGVVREFVGGYSDWQKSLAQRLPVTTTERKVATPTSGGRTAKNLSNKERQEWKQLPGQIEQLETELAVLGQALSDPEFFKRGDPAKVKASAERVAQIPQQIEKAFERWAELDARK
ncbi:MAG: ATP-binding cassette domain-containing protein [Verrucomicrobia bacterium]|nr:ATP-binding cassette domain-containing protein [Verrucomicrobiota bacterium]